MSGKYPWICRQPLLRKNGGELRNRVYKFLCFLIFSSPLLNICCIVHWCNAQIVAPIPAHGSDLFLCQPPQLKLLTVKFQPCTPVPFSVLYTFPVPWAASFKWILKVSNHHLPQPTIINPYIFVFDHCYFIKGVV